MPTRRIVDAVYAQATIKLTPLPMAPTAQMVSNVYHLEHHRLVEEQLALRVSRRGLIAGHKKDVVLTPRLAQHPDRVAIHGWHQPDGTPIQPLSTVHTADYADYSHGLRLVCGEVRINGRRLPLAQVLADSVLAPLLSDEGPFDAEAPRLRRHADGRKRAKELVKPCR